ncbi:T5orf172 domain-containing protein [Roseivivax marinus]|uniref:GIY-YIG nuclease family protein n=1 Tax=Roseivivax marinus TaxID=1379903 RepID=UPI0008C322E0|nr:GIY-YIG nuclease family protein [Roseivivax marinus]SEK94958.1 T5orf172 domain-containing protein [Roseivivax marinus]
MAERSDLDILADLGVDPIEKKTIGTNPREARIIAGFEDIQKFVEDHGRPPQHGADRDIFERLYAVRLDRLRDQADCKALLGEMDTQGLLSFEREEGTDQTDASELDDDDLLASLGVGAADESGLTDLKHVRSHAERRAALEDIASRQTCQDFDQFEPLFEAVRSDIAEGVRQTLKFERKSEIEPGRFFIVDGMTAYVAHAGDFFTNESGNRDSRLRVIFDNGTESNLLARSLQKALTQDPSGRRITDPDAGPLFNNSVEGGGSETGTIYVLRSLSDHPTVAANREVIHKIGVTGGQVERRCANAAKEPTFLMADVELVAKFELIDINRVALENLLHRFFAPGRLDITIQDRFGTPVHPREWFIVPVDVVHEAVELLQDKSLHRYEYRPEQGKIMRRPGVA